MVCVDNFFCSNYVKLFFALSLNPGYAPRYSSVEDPTYSIHGSLGYDQNLDNSVFEDQPQLGAPRAIFDEDERLLQQQQQHLHQPRESSPDKMNFGGSQRGSFAAASLDSMDARLRF